jgi:formylglycine-generating enzyme required for sulfatase activity
MTDASNVLVTAELNSSGRAASVNRSIEEGTVLSRSTAAGDGIYAAFTGPDGKFSLTGLPEGTYTVTAEKEHTLGAVVQNVFVGETQSRATVTLDIVLTATGSISGTASLEDTSSAYGTFIYAAGTSYVAAADETGNFTISNIPVGIYTIVYYHAGYVTQTEAMVEVEAAQTGSVTGAVLVRESGTERPFVVYTSPTANEVDVRRDATVSIVFNTEMDETTINSSTVVLADSAGAPVNGTFSFSENTVTFVPDQVLNRLEKYSVTVSALVENAAGIAMGYEFKGYFTTDEAVDEPGVAVSITVGSETVKLIYANNQTSIIFPFSSTSGTPVDNNPATLTRKFFMSETQVTNALMTEVLQWAYNNGKFSTTVGDHNGLDSTTAKHGAQQLLYLDDAYIKINYSSGSFTVDSGFEDHPVVNVTWYGAIMFCNWLTEMRDGSTTNAVYTGIDTTWDHTETVENADRNGYRLPSSGEWEYAARYIGTTAPTEGNLATEYVAQSYNSGHATLTAGYYWTPADYASGAIRDYNNATDTRAVAWYSGDPAMGGDKLMQITQKTANQLGLYDMSGNVWEWCFTAASGVARVVRGGSWHIFAVNMQVGSWSFYDPRNGNSVLGFRFARTQREAIDNE